MKRTVFGEIRTFFTFRQSPGDQVRHFLIFLLVKSFFAMFQEKLRIFMVGQCEEFLRYTILDLGKPKMPPTSLFKVNSLVAILVSLLSTQQ